VQPKRPKSVLGAHSIVRGDPQARYQAPKEETPTGDGERVAPVQQSGYTYSIQEGFKTVDGPLGVPYPPSLRAGLINSLYDPKPMFVVGEGVVRIEVFARTTSTEFLAVLHSAGLEQLVVAKKFPDLMDLLAKWEPVVKAASAPEADAPYRVYSRQGVLMAEVGALEEAMTITPLEDGACVLVREKPAFSFRTVKRFDRAAGGWVEPLPPG
jgi:hypothetical protein